jgi:tetratricopeptide (TPR) repeat protein
MAAHPEFLKLVNATALDLRALGRFDEALSLLQSALDQARQAPKAKPAFKDQAEQLNWTTDQKAYALLELGRVDEALNVERAGAHLKEGQAKNVSQRINLAGMLNMADRPKEVLDVLKPFDSGLAASPYGVAWVHAERACADERLGRTAELNAELAYLADHGTDNVGASLKARLCANQLDAAGALAVSMLQDKEQRAATLINLSEFSPRPHPTAVALILDGRLATVRSRPDVRAAIDKVGHTEHIPLNADVFIDAF